MKKFRIVVLAALAMMLAAGILLAAGIVDLNTASAKDLEALRGVGPATARKIIAARPYASVAELSKAGLSAKQIAALRPLVSVSVAAAAPAPQATSRPATRTTAARAQAVTPTGPVDLNTGSAKDLEALRGVGPATARKIIAARPYGSVADLSKAGLSAKKIAELSGAVTVGVSVAAPAPVPAGMPARVPTSRASAAAPSGPIDLNTASQKDLEALKGVGPATARKIIAARPYRSVGELTRAGVSAKVIAEIGSQVMVSGAPSVAAATAVPSRSVPTPAAVNPLPPAATPVPAPVPASVPVSAPSARPVSASHAKLMAGQIVNINTASLETLELLPGIGPVKAQAIIAGRPFATPEDIMKVKGIKTGEFAKIKDSISVK